MNVQSTINLPFGTNSLVFTIPFPHAFALTHCIIQKLSQNTKSNFHYSSPTSLYIPMLPHFFPTIFSHFLLLCYGPSPTFFFANYASFTIFSYKYNHNNLQPMTFILFLHLFTPPPPLMATNSSYHSLFSCIVSLYTLIFLYFPCVFVKSLLSPLLVSTLVLLLTLLRLGTSQQLKQEQQQQQQQNIDFAEGVKTPRQVIIQNDLEPNLKPESGPIQEERNVVKARSTTEPGPKPEHLKHVTCDPGRSVEIIDSFENQEHKKEKGWAGPESLEWAEPEPEYGPKVFLDWDVGAPLEVIYEAYEGEEEGEESQNDVFCKAGIIKRYPSLSRYYPESESDSGSDSDSYSYSSSSFDEEEREGLIEIALDDYGYNYGDKKMINMLIKPKSGDQKAVYHNFDDEDNLIEIEINPTKNMSDFPW
ncbi:uncharacterized protein LOC110693525 [Chenopodium quinoa]|uniref:uncharacterized protein LOC110693525 n=1 Tax=Chenopodium quinoa TaxID=63459 RepID=UPI000B7743BE|nr:uncharacterized protein LOC110693525 [Chenopodium quinoa]